MSLCSCFLGFYIFLGCFDHFGLQIRSYELTKSCMKCLYQGCSESTKWIPNDQILLSFCRQIDHDLCDFWRHHPNSHRSIPVHISLGIALYILYPDCFCNRKSCLISIEHELYPLFYQFFMNSSSCFCPSIIVLHYAYRASLLFESILHFENERLESWHKSINTYTEFFTFLSLFRYFFDHEKR